MSPLPPACSHMAQPAPDDARAALDAILQRYDVNKDRMLSKDEIDRIVEEYRSRQSEVPAEVLLALRRYDRNADGTLDAEVRGRAWPWAPPVLF